MNFSLHPSTSNVVIGHQYGSPTSSAYTTNTIGNVGLNAPLGYTNSPPSYHQTAHRSSEYHHPGQSHSPKVTSHLASNYEAISSMYGNNGHNTNNLMSPHHAQTVVHYAAPQQAHHVSLKLMSKP